AANEGIDAAIGMLDHTRLAVKIAKAARDGQNALAQTLVSSWKSTEDGIDLLLARERYRRLNDLLASGRMKVRVVPRDADNV
ncbi:hypothetical protein AB9F42_35270, partial [Rhizobium leguminosarum]|uniref:hypothetical protein n=1 Tax=Rhizobium leguminosarum TaxID=384 RepID=UPI003F996791